jgi:hypothetical protein
LSPRRRAHARASKRTTWAAAALLSGAVHVVLLAGLRFALPETHDASSNAAHTATPPAVMRALELRLVTGSPAAPAVDPVPTRTLDTRVGEPDATENPLPASAERPDPARRVADVLAPRVGDARLWDRPAEALRPELEPLNVAGSRVRSPIEAYNDSVAAAAEAARSAADWTATRAYGERWGFSPDTIHLGNTRRVLRKCSAGPCPGYLIQPPAGRREAQADLLRTFAETQIQARRADLERAFQANVRTLRARADSVRASRKGGGR